MDAISAFVTQLAMYPRVPLAFNPWFDYDEERDLVGAPTMRQKALSVMLHTADKPKYAIVGLAPGYAGARFSGVPFVDEHHIEAWLGIRTSTRTQPWSENSATVVIAALKRLDILDETVMWNAFPFHPHELGKPMTNRTPTTDEIRVHGLPLLARFLETVSPGTVIPVGRAAERAVHKWTEDYRGVPATQGQLPLIAPYVRHPSYGGEAAFNAGLISIVRGTT